MGIPQGLSPLGTVPGLLQGLEGPAEEIQAAVDLLAADDERREEAHRHLTARQHHHSVVHNKSRNKVAARAPSKSNETPDDLIRQKA